MHLGNKKGHPRLRAIGEVNQLFPNIWVIEEGILFLRPALQADTGIFVEVVIPAHPVVVQDLKDCFTACTAKNLILQVDVVILAGFPAMIAGKFRAGCFVDQFLIV